MAAPRYSVAQQVRRHIADSVRTAPKGNCAASTLRCADARDYGSELRECCKSHLRKIVTDCADVLAKYGVTWWADYGTLLGAVRNPLTTWSDYPWLPQADRATRGPAPGVVPHDKDCDFGLLVPSWAEGFRIMTRVRTRLERMGYHVLVRPNGRSMKVRLSFTNHTNADFFAWMQRPDGLMIRQRFIGVDKYKGREMHRDAVFPLSSVEWEGMRLPAPVDPAAFCRFRYGPNWMTPVRANNDGVKR